MDKNKSRKNRIIIFFMSLNIALVAFIIFNFLYLVPKSNRVILDDTYLSFEGSGYEPDGPVE